MDLNGNLRKTRKVLKEITTTKIINVILLSLKNKKFIRYINHDYVSYLQVCKEELVFKTEKKIILRKEFNWRSRLLFSILYESISDDQGLFVIGHDFLKKVRTNRHFRKEIKEFVSEDGFLRSAGKIKVGRYEYDRFCFIDKLIENANKKSIKIHEI